MRLACFERFSKSRNFAFLLKYYFPFRVHPHFLDYLKKEKSFGHHFIQKICYKTSSTKFNSSVTAGISGIAFGATEKRTGKFVQFFSCDYANFAKEVDLCTSFHVPSQRISPGVVMETNSANVKSTPQPEIEVEQKFVVTDHSEDKLREMGAQLLGTKTFVDTYYDTVDHTLTMQDYWLRQRDDLWQLKYPPANRTAEKFTTQYAELEDENCISQVLLPLLQSDCKEDLASLVSRVLKPFAKFTTYRKKYILDGFYIDIDMTDSGFSVGEIETVVKNDDQIPVALEHINSLAEKLGFQADKRILGKMEAYLSENNAEHYRSLIAAHVLAE